MNEQAVSIPVRMTARQLLRRRWDSIAQRSSTSHLPPGLVIFSVLLIISHALLYLINQPAAFWVDWHIHNHHHAPFLLANGPWVFAGIVLVYLLLMAALLVRLRLPYALALSAGLSSFHIPNIAWLNIHRLAPFSGLPQNALSYHRLFLLLFISWLLVYLLTLASAFRPGLGVSPRIRPWLGRLAFVLGILWLGLLSFGLFQAAFIPSSGWRPVLPNHSPAKRFFAAAAYDPDRQRAVLFGGIGEGEFGSPFLSDTWEWDGSDWHQVITEHTPPGRVAHTMGYDPDTGQVLLAGGYNQNGNLKDAWLYDGRDWQKLGHCSACPEPRFSHGMIYDEENQELLIYGGRGGDLHRSDSLISALRWKGSRFDLEKYAGPAPEAEAFGFVYESHQQRALAFVSGRWAGTWTLHNRVWTPLDLAMEPPIRMCPQMVYDPNEAHTILFGGWVNPPSGQKYWLNDTWLFQNDTWSRVNTQLSPEPRECPVMFYDTTRHSIILFGGKQENWKLFNDTWELTLP